MEHPGKIGALALAYIRLTVGAMQQIRTLMLLKLTKPRMTVDDLLASAPGRDQRIPASIRSLGHAVLDKAQAWIRFGKNFSPVSCLAHGRPLKSLNELHWSRAGFLFGNSMAPPRSASAVT